MYYHKLFKRRFREHVVWTDKDVKLKLLRKGILTRIYAPMVSIGADVYLKNPCDNRYVSVIMWFIAHFHRPLLKH